MNLHPNTTVNKLLYALALTIVVIALYNIVMILLYGPY
jgi:hypothetical protein